MPSHELRRGNSAAHRKKQNGDDAANPCICVVLAGIAVGFLVQGARLTSHADSQLSRALWSNASCRLAGAPTIATQEAERCVRRQTIGGGRRRRGSCLQYGAFRQYELRAPVTVRRQEVLPKVAAPEYGATMCKPPRVECSGDACAPAWVDDNATLLPTLDRLRALRPGAAFGCYVEPDIPTNVATENADAQRVAAVSDHRSTGRTFTTVGAVLIALPALAICVLCGSSLSGRSGYAPVSK